MRRSLEHLWPTSKQAGGSIISETKFAKQRPSREEPEIPRGYVYDFPPPESEITKCYDFDAPPVVNGYGPVETLAYKPHYDDAGSSLGSSITDVYSDKEVKGGKLVSRAKYRQIFKSGSFKLGTSRKKVSLSASDTQLDEPKATGEPGTEMQPLFNDSPKSASTRFLGRATESPLRDSTGSTGKLRQKKRSLFSWRGSGGGRNHSTEDDDSESRSTDNTLQERDNSCKFYVAPDEDENSPPVSYPLSDPRHKESRQFTFEFAQCEFLFCFVLLFTNTSYFKLLYFSLILIFSTNTCYEFLFGYIYY